MGKKLIYAFTTIHVRDVESKLKGGGGSRLSRNLDNQAKKSILRSRHLCNKILFPIVLYLFFLNLTLKSASEIYFYMYQVANEFRSL